MYQPIISKNIRNRVPNKFIIGEGSIVDDFCYFSVQVSIGRFCHIANGVSIAGGKDQKFTFGSFGSISSGVKIWCASDDFVNDMSCLTPPELDIPKNTIVGDVTLGELTIIGSNSVIMPQQNIPDGVAIGALSFVPTNYVFEEWTVYAGTPIRKIKNRNKKEVVHQKNLLLKKIEEVNS